MKYISGGYYLISPIKRPDYLDKDLIPDSILSVSDCLCDFHPDINVLWGGSNNNKEKYMEQLKITQSIYEEMENWVGGMAEKEIFEYPQMFTSLDLAREFCSEFLNHIDDVNIIGIGLSQDYADEFIEYEETLTKPKEERNGIEKLLLNNVLVDNNGLEMVGYEVLGFESGKFHSYLCNGLEKDFNKQFRFSLNKSGFIPSLEEAARYCEYSNDEELGEHVLWLPWAIFTYAK